MSELWQRRQVWIAAAAGAVVLGLGVWLVVATLPAFLTTPDPGAANTRPDSSTGGRRIHAALYYVSADGTALVAMNREIPYAGTAAEQARRIVEAQVEPPPAGARSAIPAGTTVRAVFLSARNEAYVDLGGAIVSGHPGGSLEEALTVYTIVNAISVNMPDISGVQVLVEGKEVDTLAGHIDLRYPLAKSLDWIRKGSSLP